MGASKRENAGATLDADVIDLGNMRWLVAGVLIVTAASLAGAKMRRRIRVA